MERTRQFFRHVFNPLHVYCRLRDVGMRPASAKRMCRVYERLFFGKLPM
jgi:hypothetical protein